MKQPEAIYVLISFGLLAIVLGTWITHSLHQSWQLFARISRDWQRQAEMHDLSASRHQVALETGSAEQQALLATFIQHDRANTELCRKQVEHWAEKIPGRYRESYLLAAAREHG